MGTFRRSLWNGLQNSGTCDHCLNGVVQDCTLSPSRLIKTKLRKPTERTGPLGTTTLSTEHSGRQRGEPLAPTGPCVASGNQTFGLNKTSTYTLHFKIRQRGFLPHSLAPTLTHKTVLTARRQQTSPSASSHLHPPPPPLLNLPGLNFSVSNSNTLSWTFVTSPKQTVRVEEADAGGGGDQERSRARP